MAPKVGQGASGSGQGGPSRGVPPRGSVWRGAMGGNFRGRVEKGGRGRGGRGGGGRDSRDRGGGRGGRGRGRGRGRGGIQGGVAKTTLEDVFSKEFLQDMRTFRIDDEVARGGDHPKRGNEWAILSKRVPCSILFSHQTMETAVYGGHGTSDWPLLKWACNYYSQNPKLLLDFGNVEFELGAEHLAMDEAKRSAAPQEELDISQINEQSIREALARLQIINVKAEHITTMEVKGQRGLQIIAVQLSNPVIGRRMDRSKTYVKDKDVVDRLMAVHGIRIAIILVPFVENELRLSFWRSRLDICVEMGIYHFYNDIILDDEPGERFTSKKSEGLIKRQPWMKMPDDTVTPESYASHVPIMRFSSTKEYEIVQKMAILLEDEFQRKAIQQTFNHDVPHWATISNDNGNVTLGLEISQCDETVKGLVQLGNKFTVRSWSPSLAIESTQVIDGTEAPITIKAHDGDWDCYVVDGTPGPWDCTLAVMATADKKSCWIDGSRIQFTLEMDCNSVPLRRQLGAISSVTKLPKDSSVLRILLANDYNGIMVASRQSLREETQQLASLQQQTWLAEYYGHSDLNREQKQVFDNTFGPNKGIALVQGPPGTGKTSTCAMIAVAAAIMGIPVLATAPSNTAAKELARKIAWEVESLPKGAADSFDWMYFPTMTQTKDDILTEHIVRTSGSMQESTFEDVHFYQHILRHVQSRATMDGPYSDAQQWLAKRQAILDGGHLTNKSRKSFARLLWEFGQAVFASKRLKIVVSTCNNSAHEARVPFTPWLVIVDEAAFALEAEALIAIRGSPKVILLAGDHEQLSPIVTSVRDNEYGGQLALSLFERILQLAVPFTCLKLNYRMPTAIADIVGVIKYGGLGSHESTLERRSLYMAWEQFWEHPSNAALRAMRRAPLNRPAKPNPSIRRLFFNVNGRSGPQEGSGSLMNFANINTITWLCQEFCAFHPTSVHQVRPDDITIQVPYSAQKNMMIRQLRLRAPSLPLTVKTIDSNQGGESRMVILDVTPANTYHGSAVGFLKGWNRMNVGLSRASEVLIVVGNLDCWMRELDALPIPWGLFLTDLLDQGDVVDLQGDWSANHNLPSTLEEVDGEIWTTVSPPSNMLTGQGVALHSTPDSRCARQIKLLKDLQALRITADASISAYRLRDKKAMEEAAEDSALEEPMEDMDTADEIALHTADLDLDLAENMEEGEVPAPVAPHDRLDEEMEGD